MGKVNLFWSKHILIYNIFLETFFYRKIKKKRKKEDDWLFNGFNIFHENGIKIRIY